MMKTTETRDTEGFCKITTDADAMQGWSICALNCCMDVCLKYLCVKSFNAEIFIFLITTVLTVVQNQLNEAAEEC